jgi:NAD(P)-dependent dehydrogenase (short-subunit alcohol dehydrogenase family)
MVDRIVLVTGGNKGLVFETARRLKALGYTVYIGARDSARGEGAAATLGVAWLQLDVTDEGSVSRAASALDARARRLDILVNNAGVAGPRKAVADLTGEDAEAVFDTNLIGPIRVIHAFPPLLAKSSAPVNVSSGLGSFARPMIRAASNRRWRFRSIPSRRLGSPCSPHNMQRHSHTSASTQPILAAPLPTSMTTEARKASRREPTRSSNSRPCRRTVPPAHLLIDRGMWISKAHFPLIGQPLHHEGERLLPLSERHSIALRRWSRFPRKPTSGSWGRASRHRHSLC